MTSSGLRRLPTSGSLASSVAIAVRDAIRSGALRPGERYSVYQLASDLGVSRTPVRDAMITLSQSGLVTIEKNRGFRVLLPDPNDIADLFAIRLALEPTSAARFAEQADDATVTGLVAAQDRLTEAAHAGDEDIFWGVDKEVHRRIADGSGNLQIHRVLDDLRERIGVISPPSTTSQRDLIEVAGEHQRFIDAIRARDATAAEAAMASHLRSTASALLKQMFELQPVEASAVAEAHRRLEF